MVWHKNNLFISILIVWSCFREFMVFIKWFYFLNEFFHKITYFVFSSLDNNVKHNLKAYRCQFLLGV
jgi:hypothetical protein